MKCPPVSRASRAEASPRPQASATRWQRPPWNSIAPIFSGDVEAGMVWLNSNNVRDLRTPFGGVKASGLGHEGGYRSIDFYTDQQAVHINLGEVHNPIFGKQ